MKSPDSRFYKRMEHQRKEFAVRTRQSLIIGVLTCYGTAEQEQATLEKMKNELALQGIDFKIDRVELD